MSNRQSERENRQPVKKKIIAIVAVLVAAAVGAYLAIRYQADRAARRQVESVALRIPHVKSVDYGSAHVDWLSSEIRVKNVTLVLEDPEERIPIEEVLVHDFDPDHEIPDRLDAEIRGVHLNASQPRLRGLKPLLDEAGYDTLRIDCRLAYRYERGKRRLEVDRLEVAAEGAGTLSLNARFDNIDLPRLVGHLSDKIYLITALPAVSVSAAELAYADQSLARRVLATLAAKTGRTPQAVASALNADLERRFGRTDGPLVRAALAGLQAFIAAPGTLRVAAAPPSPVSLLNFLWVQSPSDVVELLHLRVEG